MQRNAIILAAASVLALAACKKNPPEELPPAPIQTPAPTGPGSQTPTPSAGARPGSQAHFAAAMAGRDTIFFDTDRYNIDSEDAAALRTQAEYIIANSGARATVEGHADERGTREYNLALGERRANAAKNYLVSLGVAENRLRVVSYGEERPASTASNDTAWARNRRAVTVMID